MGRSEGTQSVRGKLNNMRPKTEQKVECVLLCLFHIFVSFLIDSTPCAMKVARTV